THYEVERRRKFAQRESLPRGGLTIDAQYNDMFKFIFGFGGGSLRILDREGNLLREIRWVFFLPRVRQRIDEIVEVAPVAALAAGLGLGAAGAGLSLGIEGTGFMNLFRRDMERLSSATRVCGSTLADIEPRRSSPALG